MTDKTDAWREALVQIVNVLGSPRKCPTASCPGCEYEREEAIREGLIALGYLEPPKYRLARIEKNAAGGDCHVYEPDGPQPDAVKAWEEFFDKELRRLDDVSGSA